MVLVGIRWGQRFPAGPEGPFQPSADARKRMAVGHPNFSYMKMVISNRFYGTGATTFVQEVGRVPLTLWVKF